MKTRILIFKKMPNLNKNPGSPELIYFYVNKSSFEKDLQITLDDFAQKNALLRKTDFDWAVGDAGAKCALFEANKDKPTIDAQGEWLNFPQAARTLADGEDKRYLQLAVQYIAAGGINDSVIASDYDLEFLNTLKKALEEKEQLS